MFKHLIFVIFFILSTFFCKNAIQAQGNQLKQPFELHTKEVYDLLVDKRGFLWIASDLGVARYDGINYINFTTPLQTSLGCTGLIEDNYGRIWFNNFTAQVFYIQDEKVNLFDGYNAKNESSFPHSALFKDELLLTSDKGLYIINTSDLKGRYIKSTNSAATLTSSVAVFNNKVIAFGAKQWYMYTIGGILKHVPFTDSTKPVNIEAVTLYNTTKGDTAFAFSNPSGTVKRFIVAHDTIKQVGQDHFNTFINSIAFDGNKQWVNTTNTSYLLNGTTRIKNLNLTDVVTDLEGNQWYSSLNRGVYVKYKDDLGETIPLKLIDTNDFVISVKRYQNKILLGTQNGALVMYDPVLKLCNWRVDIPKNDAIYSIQQITGTKFLIGCSITAYQVNIETRQLSEVNFLKSVKQVSDYEDMTAYGASSGIYITPKTNTPALKQIISKRFGGLFSYNEKDGYFFLKKRCRALCYYPEEQALLVAFKDGLFRINKNGLSPVMYNKKQVYATSVAYVNHNLFIGTINAGLLILNKGKYKNFTTESGMFSNSIYKLKPIGQHLWVLGSGPLQLFDLDHLIPGKNYEMPSTAKVQVTDVAEFGTNVYVTTFDGVLKFPLKQLTTAKRPRNYLLSVKVNDQTFNPTDRLQLKSDKNNILFKIGVPVYNDAKNIALKYCLITGSDSIWRYTEPGERTINFSSLMPGSYTFKVLAIDPRYGSANNTITYKFSVLPQWWRRVWFKLLVSILVLLFISYVYTNEMVNRQSLKNAYDEQQQSIKIERQRISSEIHDDIGAGIFAINLYAELASKKRAGIEEISQIKLMIDELSDKIREIIWTTNIENDNLENLLYFIQFQIGKLFEHTPIALKANLPNDNLNFHITSQARRNIYLIVKEMGHNILKHSKATRAEMNVYINEENLTLIFKDNGIGINPAKIIPNAMGLKNLRSRVQSLHGELTIESHAGTTIIILLPLSEIVIKDIMDKQPAWVSFFMRGGKK